MKELLQSFKHALRGVRVVFRTEQSFRIQIVVAFIVILAGWFLHLTEFEFIVVLSACAAVLVLELINSIFERIVDAFKPRVSPIVRDIKDIMAGTVLVAVTAAVLVGLVIFVPHLATLRI
jgi:diacylglycerol kinase